MPSFLLPRTSSPLLVVFLWPCSTPSCSVIQGCTMDLKSKSLCSSIASTCHTIMFISLPALHHCRRVVVTRRHVFFELLPKALPPISLNLTLCWSFCSVSFFTAFFYYYFSCIFLFNVFCSFRSLLLVLCFVGFCFFALCLFDLFVVTFVIGLVLVPPYTSVHALDYNSCIFRFSLLPVVVVASKRGFK